MNRIQHTPDLSAVLPHTKGTASPQKVAHSPQKKWKRNQTEEVFGIKWYPYYVRNKSSVALSDVHDETELLKMFNVCYNIPQGDEEKNRRFFSAFHSPLDFLQYIKQIPSAKWAFFEYILGDQTQKLYFDVDIALVDFQKALPGVNVDTYCTELIDNLVQQIDETFDERGIQLDLARHILLFSSHAAHKRSFHLVINGFAVSNHRENYVLANEVLEQLPQKYLQFVDTGMWTSKQQFRLYLSQKPGSNRPKVFVPSWYCRGELIHSNILNNLSLPQNATDAAGLQLTTLFMASCVTVTQNCRVLPDTLFQNHEFSRSANSAQSDFNEDEITAEVIQSICERAPTVLFEIYKVKEVNGSLIVLSRKKPAYCSLCKTQHDNDNAFLSITSQGHVYFHCHGVRRHLARDNMGNLIGETRKHVANIQDLLSSKSEELAEAHKESIIKNLLAQIPKVGPSVNTPLPTTQTVHGRLKELSSQPNTVIKARQPQY